MGYRYEGVSSLYTNLGDCAWSCEHCAAMFWYGERLKGYSKTMTLINRGSLSSLKGLVICDVWGDVPYVIQNLGQHLIISTTLRAATRAVKCEDNQRLFHNAAMRKQRSDVSDRWVGISYSYVLNEMHVRMCLPMEKQRDNAPTWISGPSFPSILTNKEGKVDGLCDGSIMARVRKLTGCPSNVFGDQVPNYDSKTDEAALFGSMFLVTVKWVSSILGAAGYDGLPLVLWRKAGRIYCLEASEMARTHLMTRASVTGVASNITYIRANECEDSYGQGQQNFQNRATNILPRNEETVTQAPQLELVACAPNPYYDPYYGGMMAAYGQHMVHPQFLDMHQVRMPLPLEMAWAYLSSNIPHIW
ncbi:nuclear transcription factor Y subunit A-9-like protein [Tanacetum coccineum]